LAALIVAEGLQRRHAPGWMKRLVLVGGALFVGLALLRRPEHATPFAIALGSFVGLSLLIVALMLFLRRRATLSRAENNAISALGMGLVLALPFQASDFLHAADMAPIRAGGMALLLFVLAAARLDVTGAGASGLALDLVWALAGAGIAFGVLALTVPIDSLADGLAFFLIVFALVCVILIAHGLRERKLSAARQGMLTALADAPLTPADAFVEHILSAPEWRDGAVLREHALIDYQPDRLRALFSANPLIDARVLAEAGAAAGPGAFLVEAHEATHAIALSTHPLVLLLVCLPAHAASSESDLTLRLAQKLAAAASLRAPA
jgi:hypothetical protein